MEGCKGGQAAPAALMAEDSVLLAATDKGGSKECMVIERQGKICTRPFS